MCLYIRQEREEQMKKIKFIEKGIRKNKKSGITLIALVITIMVDQKNYKCLSEK